MIYIISGSLTWDGILGFFGGIIGVIGAWMIANWQYREPQRNALKKFSFIIKQGLDEILETSFTFDSDGTYIRSTNNPQRLLKKTMSNSEKIIQDFRPFLNKNKSNALHAIDNDLFVLKEELQSYIFEGSKLKRREQKYYVKDISKFANQIMKIKKSLEKL